MKLTVSVLVLGLCAGSLSQQQRKRQILYYPTETEVYTVLPSGVRTHEPCSYEGFFEDTEDCSKFYRCVDYGYENGIRVLNRHRFQCAQGTVYDPYRGVCNHISRAQVSPTCQAQLTWGRTQIQAQYAPTFQSTYSSLNYNPFANVSPTPNVRINGNYNPNYNSRRYQTLARAGYTPSLLSYPSRSTPLPIERNDNSLTDIDISPYFLQPQALVAKEDSTKTLSKLFARTSYHFTSEPYIQYQVQVPYAVNQKK